MRAHTVVSIRASIRRSPQPHSRSGNSTLVVVAATAAAVVLTAAERPIGRVHRVMSMRRRSGRRNRRGDKEPQEIEGEEGEEEKGIYKKKEMDELNERKRERERRQ